MSILQANKPAYAPTRGHVWPIEYDPTSQKKTEGRDKSLAPMDVDTPGAGGSQAGSTTARPEEESIHARNTITAPLAHAIRTTAVYVDSVSPLVPPPVPPSGKKSVVRTAMALAAAAHTAQINASTAPVEAGSAEFVSGLSAALNRPGLDIRRVSTPGTPGSPYASTPGPDGASERGVGKKKKKRE